MNIKVYNLNAFQNIVLCTRTNREETNAIMSKVHGVMICIVIIKCIKIRLVV